MPLSPRAVARRAKKYLREHALDIFLVVQPGLENVARDEIIQHFPNAVQEPGGIALHGDLSAVYELNLCSRFGTRVLIRLATFLAQTYPMLYHHTRRVPWEILLGNSQDVDIRVSFSKSRLRNKAHISSVVLDAISARASDVGLSRGDPTEAGPTRIQARLVRDRCTLSLDATGAHLHKRGYRLATGRAPIRETIAAGILAMARSSDYDVLVDPFCGSGTICIEADLLARNVPPGCLRTFSIESSPLFAPGISAHARRAAAAKLAHSHRQRILGFDIDESVVAIARENAGRARTTMVEFHASDAMSIDYSMLKSPRDRGLIVSNLPYGERLSTKSGAEEIFRRFQHRLGETGSGWDFAVVTTSPDALEDTRLAVRDQIRLVNGGLPVTVIFGHVE